MPSNVFVLGDFHLLAVNDFLVSPGGRSGVRPRPGQPEADGADVGGGRIDPGTSRPDEVALQRGTFLLKRVPMERSWIVLVFRVPLLAVLQMPGAASCRSVGNSCRRR